jgi:hypothetical protein
MTEQKVDAGSSPASSSKNMLFLYQGEHVCFNGKAEDMTYNGFVAGYAYPVSEAAVNIRKCLSQDDPELAVRHFIQLSDVLTAAHGLARAELTEDIPDTTGVAHWDAALAAVAEHYLGQEQLYVPSWTQEPEKFLNKPWIFGSGKYDIPVPEEEVPPAFLRHGVLIYKDTLISY